MSQERDFARFGECTSGEIMTGEVVVSRRGQITIPAKLRKKYSIREGAKLKVEDAGDGILFKKLPSIFDLIGSGSKEATVQEMKQLLDEMRASDEEG